MDCIDDIGKMVYDFDGRKLLEGITGNAGHFASKADAELFIKGELSKVLVKKDAGNLIPSEKAIDLVSKMNGQLKGELGFTGNKVADATRMVELFGNPNGSFFQFIKVN